MNSVFTIEKNETERFLFLFIILIYTCNIETVENEVFGNL
jgi:hypothetical protein